MLRLLARAGAFAVLCLGLLEVFFRFVLPAREVPYPWQEPEFGLMLYEQRVTDGLFTSGRLAEQRSPWHINRTGWNAGIEYLPASERGRPAVAVIGDSQGEGFYVSWDEHIAGRLTTLSGGQIEGHSYGGSAYQLPTYVRVARYLAKHRIDPEVLVFLLNRGDFWSSVRELGRARAQLATWSIDAAGVFTEHPPAPYRSTVFRRFMRESAFVRYLVFNANLNPVADGPVEIGMVQRSRYPEAEEHVQKRIVPITEHFLDEVARALPRARVLFVVDADRREIHQGKVPARLEFSALVEGVCQRRGCGFIDMTDRMVADWAAHQAPFHFAHNAHWNARGHAIHAEAIHAWLVAEGWVKPAPAP